MNLCTQNLEWFLYRHQSFASRFSQRFSQKNNIAGFDFVNVHKNFYYRLHARLCENIVRRNNLQVEFTQEYIRQSGRLKCGLTSQDGGILSQALPQDLTEMVVTGNMLVPRISDVKFIQLERKPRGEPAPHCPPPHPRPQLLNISLMLIYWLTMSYLVRFVYFVHSFVEKLQQWLLFGCFVLTGNVSCNTYGYVVRAIVASLPAWFRFAQCVRRYYDSRLAFPHLVNAGKYSTTFFVVLFSSLCAESKYPPISQSFWLVYRTSHLTVNTDRIIILNLLWAYSYWFWRRFKIIQTLPLQGMDPL